MLLLAAEIGNSNPIETLLKYRIESRLQEREVTAQSLAWEGRHFDVLLKLLKNNLPFPPLIDASECSEELKKFIDMCEEFHEMIKDKNRKKLYEILNQNPNLRHFYNLANNSAIKTALDHKMIRIYDLLISKNLSFGPHEDTNQIWEKFKDSEKKKLREINLKYSKEIPEKHINVLMLNTSLSHDETDEEEKRKLILNAYQKLNSDSRLKIILQIVAASKIFHIFFDFHRDSTYRIDPTTSPGTQAIFYSSGRIIIGAKQLLKEDTENETFGSLIHELMHYAMLIVYENQSDPYTSNDQEANAEFTRISELCKQIMNEEPIIRSVFKDYPLEHQPSELIVRPPHLIAFYIYEPDILQDVIATFNELFHHYINVTVPAMERALPEIESRLAYKPTYTFGKLPDHKKEIIKNANVLYKNLEVKISKLFPENVNIFEKLTSDHISQILSEKILDFNDPHFRYLEEQIRFSWENLAEEIKKKFLASNINFQSQVVSFKDLNESYPDAFKTLTSEQITQVLNEDEILIGERNENITDFYIERKFIHEDSKMMYFDYKCGYDYVLDVKTFDEHVENRTKNISFEEFSNDLQKKNFESFLLYIDKVRENIYFKTRLFDLSNNDFIFMHKNFEKIIKQVEKEKILILSSGPGAGKTTTFRHLTKEIKKMFPVQWVSYIDLKRFTNIYNTKESNQNVMSLLENTLNLSVKKNEFETTVFRKCFKSDNAILLWNGFDEISPVHNEFVLNHIKIINETTKNIQLVCTRPIYSDQLRRTFLVRTLEFVPFDEQSKKEFLREFFVFHKIPSEKIDENITKVENIIQKLNNNSDPIKYNFNTPLMLKLFAETHENVNLFESAHTYGIFEIFIEKKINIWLNKTKLNSKLLLGGSLKIIFQKYALLNEFRIFSTLGLKIRKLKIMQQQIPKGLPLEEISRTGILIITEKFKFEFLHATFSEFFVAQYFIENIFNLNENVSIEEAELRLELFHHLTQHYGNLQLNIIDFMKSYINNDNEVKGFSPIISNLLRTKFKYFFFDILDTNYPKIFEFLFEFFKKDHDLLVDLLHLYENETFYTAIFNPTYFALFTNPEKIKCMSQKYLTNEEFRALISGTNQKGKILYGMYFYSLIDIKKRNEDYALAVDSFNKTSIWDFLSIIRSRITTNEKNEIMNIVLDFKIYLYFSNMKNIFNLLKMFYVGINLNNLEKDQIQNIIGKNLIRSLNSKRMFDLYTSVILALAEKCLSSPQIFEMFFKYSILHNASYDYIRFRILWSFLKKHTTFEERIEILLQDSKISTYYSITNELKVKKCKFKYFYCCYDLTQFKLIHKAMINGDFHLLNFVSNIYHEYFTKTEIQEIVLKSNEFICNLIAYASEKKCQHVCFFLQNLFKENKLQLKEFLNRKIEPTDLSLFEFVEDFKELPIRQTSFKNIHVFSDLHNEKKFSENKEEYPFRQDFNIVLCLLALNIFKKCLDNFSTRKIETIMRAKNLCLLMFIINLILFYLYLIFISDYIFDKSE